MLDLKFSSQFVVFFGENGAGKTNILEAISLFSRDKGLRKAFLQDLVYSGSDMQSFFLEAELNIREHKVFLETCLTNGKRTAKIDASPARSLSEFENFLWILWITPSMNNVFIGPSSDRRSFIDHLVSGFNKNYKTSIKKIKMLQKERINVVTKMNNNAWLDVLENQLSEEYIKVTKTRMQYIDELHKIYNNYHSQFLRPNVELSGNIEGIFAKRSEEDAVLDIADLLKQNRPIDFERQTTSISTNKSTWNVLHPKTNLDAENCSTGEQKAFIISLLLTSMRLSTKSKTGTPILLLDDLMVHLDKRRRMDLIEELISLDVQTFMTGTEEELFQGLDSTSQKYHVQKSICTKI